MTQEEKQLLIKELCSRLPYFTMAYVTYKEGSKTMDGNQPVTTDDIDMLYESVETIEEAHYTIKPYLRPLSSMTEEEAKEVCRLENFENHIICVIPNNHTYHFTAGDAVIDWLNKNHFDYLGLIEKGLALEAPEGMYNKEEPEEESEIPIPKTVDEAVKTLAKILSKEDRDYILENGAISVHHSLGTWIRNEWGLWTGSELKNELMNMNKGLNHPDDMSNYIIEEFIKYWNNKN